ncbi:conserved unknown protein [Ectocarpus siliculosus]|uniref:Prenylcysteine lyase domain-containing protein n=1 Tax=Ectocarpus siliculosus TaxID=2880 RepID=D7G844_ECTSI|nr:conserved unknown protein [Ectocarpus siliculosus]|eukprot:CBJ27907.1 conserved unknown protein [Ectocarpus siliculosus]
MSRLGALLLVWLCHLLLTEGQEKVSIAVIGSGIGGSAASYFLREALDDDLHTKIVVFDSATKIGGRTAHYVHDGKVLESGASVIYTGNAYLFNLTERVHLNKLDPSKQEGPNTGLWDGERFVLKTTSSGIANLARMVWRYGMSLLKMRSMVYEALAKFDRIYDLQADGRVFETPEDLWSEVGLLGLARMTIAEYFEQRVGRAGSLVEVELAHAANRVNYNQGNGLNALAGVVSLCPAVTGDLFSVEGGNARLSEELLGVSASEVRLNTSVARVVGSAKGGYSLYGQGEDTLGTFDAVVIATPIGLAGISLDMRGEDGSPETPIQPLPVVKYQEVHTTFVRGVVDGAYFGLGKGEEVPNSVLLTERAAGLAFSSLALKTWVGDPADGVGVYKLFSRQELWTGMLDSLFVQGSWEILHHREWRAYPVLDPKKAFTRAKLFAGHPVWYVSSLEEGVSAMEVVVIAAKNAALGVAEALRSRNSQPGRVQEANLAADTGSVDAAASAEL